jgi:hypothetical protein
MSACNVIYNLLTKVISVTCVCGFVNNPSEISGYYMYHQFNTQQFYVLPSQCIYVFYVDLRTNSDYFREHH